MRFISLMDLLYMARIYTVDVLASYSIYCFNNGCDGHNNKNIMQKAKHKIALEICQILYKIVTIQKLYTNFLGE